MDREIITNKEEPVENEQRIRELLEILDAIEVKDDDEREIVEGELWRIQKGEAA